MTATVSDVYGYDSPEYRNYINSHWLWCIKHKEQYTSYMTTAGIYHRCQSCFDKRMKEIKEKDNV